MVQQEEERLNGLRATQVQVGLQIKGAEERNHRASLRVEELQRELQEAEVECHST